MLIGAMGQQTRKTLRIQAAPFDFGEQAGSFSESAASHGAGAVVAFTGIARDNGGSMTEMLIEHYPAMTHTAILSFIEEAVTRWNLSDAMVIHRYGRIFAHEGIMMVATAAPHRADAFTAAEFLMDYLKSRAPFWKKEIGPAGALWVAPKDGDEDALMRW